MHHRLDEYEFEQALRVGDGQGSLSCCSPWGGKELDMTERLNGTESLKIFYAFNVCSRALSISFVVSSSL